jgi:hypothetical protein
MKNKKEAVELAAQIVWEYPEWTGEHVSDMMATYDKGTEPCSLSELYDLCTSLQSFKNRGIRSDVAIKELIL